MRVIDEQTDPVDQDRLERLGRYVLARLDVPPELELAITCVDVARIRDLNEHHLAGTGPTDVLAFPIDGVDEATEGVPGLLGDVVVCPRVAIDQAAGRGCTPTAEIDLLVVHGILHLLGHDHVADAERTRMFGLTAALLAEFTAAGGRAR